MATEIGRESDKFMLRLPDGMRDRIKAVADANNRSMNAEIVATLDKKFPAPKPRGAGHAIALLARIGVLRQDFDASDSPAEREAIQALYDATMHELRLMVRELDQIAPAKIR